jgi:hypothetical protein
MVKEVTVATVQGQRGSQEDAHLIQCFGGGGDAGEDDGAEAAQAGAYVGPSVTPIMLHVVGWACEMMAQC